MSDLKKYTFRTANFRKVNKNVVFFVGDKQMQLSELKSVNMSVILRKNCSINKYYIEHLKSFRFSNMKLTFDDFINYGKKIKLADNPKIYTDSLSVAAYFCNKAEIIFSESLDHRDYMYFDANFTYVESKYFTIKSINYESHKRLATMFKFDYLILNNIHNYDINAQTMYFDGKFDVDLKKLFNNQHVRHIVIKCKTVNHPKSVKNTQLLSFIDYFNKYTDHLNQMIINRVKSNQN